MSTSGFTWRALHAWLVDYIKVRRNRQQELIDLLTELGIRGLHDEYKQGKRVQLREIDPFSFFCFIYKHGPKERLALLQRIADKFNLPSPQDQDGIARVNPMQVCMFPFGYERNSNEIDRLWDFFEAAIQDTIDDQKFADVLAVQYTGKAKITEGLFNILPEKYLPINGPVKGFIKTHYGIDPGFTTWTEYQNLLNRIRQHHASATYELSFDSWKWGMQQRSEEQEEEANVSSCNYWLFQCNPAYFDLVEALNQGTLDDWSVSAHRDSMSIGDKVIIYMTGKDAGIYALAELTSVPYKRELERDNNWSRAEEYEYKVAIKVTHDLSASPISRQQISEMSALAAFKGGNQGTNFRSSKQEYEALMSIVNSTSNVHYWLYAPGEKANRWDEFYAAGEMAIAWENLGDLSRFQSQEEIEDKLAEYSGQERRQTNNARACYEFASVLKQGDIVIAKKGSWQYVGWGIVESDYFYDESRMDYQHVRKVRWCARGNWTETVHRLVLKTLTDITKYPEYVDRLVSQLGIDVEMNRVQPSLVSLKLHPLNTILFGPPGTGKTYNTVNKALEIIDPHFMGTQPDRSAVKSRFDELANTGQICFTTFHQSLSYEDFIEGIKPTTETQSGALGYEVRDGVFKEFCETARSNWEAYAKGERDKLTFDDAWNRFVEEWEEQPSTPISTARKHFTVTSIGASSIGFRKANGDMSHSLSRNTLRDLFYGNRMMISGLSTYYTGLLDKLRSYKGITESTPLKNYVFIIDEINRGNVSQIFGELITLIEDSKRLGAPEHLTATLPYSGDEFGVPPNLYILGTMNTADRSVEALDTALRRRFSFTEMPPVYDLPALQRSLHGISLATLLTTINMRIEKLLDRDHLIGHSYFLEAGADLRGVFQNKIIPLLQEYFFGDYGKIGLVLGRGFVERVQHERGNNVFAEFDYDEASDLADRLVYRLHMPDSMTSVQFDQALQLLMA